jgi:hypothetical protein
MTDNYYHGNMRIQTTEGCLAINSLAGLNIKLLGDTSNTYTVQVHDSFHGLLEIAFSDGSIDRVSYNHKYNVIDKFGHGEIESIALRLKTGMTIGNNNEHTVISSKSEYGADTSYIIGIYACCGFLDGGKPIVIIPTEQIDFVKNNIPYTTCSLANIKDGSFTVWLTVDKFPFHIWNTLDPEKGLPDRIMCMGGADIVDMLAGWIDFTLHHDSKYMLNCIGYLPVLRDLQLLIKRIGIHVTYIEQYDNVDTAETTSIYLLRIPTCEIAHLVNPSSSGRPILRLRLVDIMKDYHVIPHRPDWITKNPQYAHIFDKKIMSIGPMDMSLCYYLHSK